MIDFYFVSLFCHFNFYHFFLFHHLYTCLRLLRADAFITFINAIHNLRTNGFSTTPFKDFRIYLGKPQKFVFRKFKSLPGIEFDISALTERGNRIAHPKALKTGSLVGVITSGYDPQVRYRQNYG